MRYSRENPTHGYLGPIALSDRLNVFRAPNTTSVFQFSAIHHPVKDMAGLRPAVC